jgi:hypothetical protein
MLFKVVKSFEHLAKNKYQISLPKNLQELCACLKNRVEKELECSCSSSFQISVQVDKMFVRHKKISKAENGKEGLEPDSA